MKTRTFVAPLVVLIVSTSLALSQDFKVPKNYKLETKEDYARYEPEVVKCIEYLEERPLDAGDRQEANAFLLKWITGSPNVNIQILPYAVHLAQENKQLLMIFLGGWTRQALLHPGDTDSLAGQMAGLESVLKVYAKGKGVVQDDDLDDLLEKQKDNTLREWLQEAVRKK